MDPLTIFLISQAVGLGASYIGGRMQNEANAKTAQANEAYSQQELAESRRSNRFNEGISKANLAINKDQNQLSKNRFAMDKQMQDYNISQAEISKLEKLMNNNVALRQQLIGNWS